MPLWDLNIGTGGAPYQRAIDRPVIERVGGIFICGYNFLHSGQSKYLHLFATVDSEDSESYVKFAIYFFIQMFQKY